MQTIGIVTDNDKLDVYKAELAKAGYHNFSITSYSSTSTMIEIKVETVQAANVSRICARIEAYFLPLD